VLISYFSLQIRQYRAAYQIINGTVSKLCLLFLRLLETHKLLSMKTGFPPIANINAKILILGSMPGEESLRKQQYFAHPRNAFWYIMGKLFSFDSTISYQAKAQALLDNYIAVWDVLQFCDRTGSLDSAILNNSIIVNDFQTFLLKHNNISNIYFNGTKAEQEYRRRVLPNLSGIQPIKYMRLSSTSPAMAKLTKEEKLNEWQALKSATTNSS